MNDIYEQLKKNPIFFGHYYLPHHFRTNSPDFHVELTLLSLQYRYLAIVAPRESAKSTILTFLHPFHGTCFNKYRCIVILQNTAEKAYGSLDSIKKEFKDNNKIIKDFKIKLIKDAVEDSVFKSPNGFETRIVCKGTEQMGAIRGIKYGAYRPDLIIVDDLEDDVMVRNPKRRQEIQDLFDEAVVPAGDKETKKIFAIGTMLHDDCLIAKLVSPTLYPEYEKIVYKARYTDPETNEVVSLWPEKWTVEELNELEKAKPKVFAKEYQADPSSGALETISRDTFKYWEEVEGSIVLYNREGTVQSRWSFKDCSAAIAIDLAWETEQSSDDSAIVPGLITPANDLLISDYIAKKGLRPDELENIIFDMSNTYEKKTGKRVKIGFEKAKLEKVMKWFLAEAQRRRNKWLWFKDVSWGSKDKVERILARVGNRYAQGAVFHKRNMGDLENQLTRLRSTAHDDLADCVGMLPELLPFASFKQKPESKENDLFKFLTTQTFRYKNKMGQKEYSFGQKNSEVIKTKVAMPTHS